MSDVQNTTMQMERKQDGYSAKEQELIRQLMQSRLQQKSPLEHEELDGYEVPPRTQFSMLKKPAVSIKYGKLLFNMASIRLFEGVQHILTLVNPNKRRLAVVTCKEEESASVEWARQKDGVWVNVEYLPQEYDLVWTQEAWGILKDSTTTWNVKGESLYGELPAGIYRIGKEIMNFRGTGDYDKEMAYAEFVIE